MIKFYVLILLLQISFQFTQQIRIHKTLTFQSFRVLTNVLKVAKNQVVQQTY